MKSKEASVYGAVLFIVGDKVQLSGVSTCVVMLTVPSKPTHPFHSSKNQLIGEQPADV